MVVTKAIATQLPHASPPIESVGFVPVESVAIDPTCNDDTCNDDTCNDDTCNDDTTLPPCNLYSDEPPLETDLHRRQIDLLIRLLEYWWRDRNNFYISGNTTVYYSAEQTRKRDFRGPDVFIVLNAEKRDRRSWTIWEEGGSYPNVVIELLSNSTAQVDRTTKKELYQNVWRLPEYYWFDPESLEFAGFRWANGSYVAIGADASGRLASEQLGLALGVYERKLRWFTTEGELIPLPEEIERRETEKERQAKEQERQAKKKAQQLARQERQAKEEAEKLANQERQAKEEAEKLANQERQAKEEERRIREKLEAYLRSQGIDPNQLPE
jgi:Uma2 family endonuclease